jgi:hypothetical protein
LGGERWDGEEKGEEGGETEEESVGRVNMYRRFPTDSPTENCHRLFRLKQNPRHHAVATFKKSFSPSAIPTVYTDGSSPSANTSGITNGIIPSLKISDEKISSIIPLVLSDFLVVTCINQKPKIRIKRR